MQRTVLVPRTARGTDWQPNNQPMGYKPTNITRDELLSMPTGKVPCGLLNPLDLMDQYFKLARAATGKTPEELYNLRFGQILELVTDGKYDFHPAGYARMETRNGNTVGNYLFPSVKEAIIEAWRRQRTNNPDQPNVLWDMEKQIIWSSDWNDGAMQLRRVARLKGVGGLGALSPENITFAILDQEAGLAAPQKLVPPAPETTKGPILGLDLRLKGLWQAAHNAQEALGALKFQADRMADTLQAGADGGK